MSEQVTAPFAPPRPLDPWTWVAAVGATAVGLVGAACVAISLLGDFIGLILFTSEYTEAPVGYGGPEIMYAERRDAYLSHVLLHVATAAAIYLGLNLVWWYLLKRRPTETWAGALVVVGATLAAVLGAVAS